MKQITNVIVPMYFELCDIESTRKHAVTWWASQDIAVKWNYFCFIFTLRARM